MDCFVHWHSMHTERRAQALHQVFMRWCLGKGDVVEDPGASGHACVLRGLLESRGLRGQLSGACVVITMSAFTSLTHHSARRHHEQNGLASTRKESFCMLA
eukprot:1158138-Pelagomonas_calceolata.AAC.5